MERENFKSRLGFLLVSAGCAIGIGNVWRFPFITGQNGGGFFVLFYLLFLVLLGAPVLTMELAVGRASRKAAVNAYKALEPPKSKWHIHGYFCIFGCAMLMMYYTSVAGWMFNYFGKFFVGQFENIPAQTEKSTAITDIFTGMLASPFQMVGCMVLVVCLGFLVNSFSIQKGLEKVTKIMMLGLFLLIIALAIHSFTLPNASEGLKFYLLPNWANVEARGLGNVLSDAMCQALFTLSLGVASMEILGSYMSDDQTLGGEAVRICALDTIVAICAGLIIFPACFAFGVKPDAGPTLIFLTLPNIFTNMEGGRIWGTLFFLFMTFASFSTVIAVFENLVSFSIETFHWKRRSAAIFCCLFMLVTSLPCALGYNLLSGVHPIPGKDILDSEDFIVSNLLLPIGSLIFLLFCVSKFGWKFDNYLAEANKGAGFKIPRWFKPYFQFVLPILLLFILIQGLV